MKRLFCILFLVAVHSAIFAQAPGKKYIYIPDAAKYVLSEQIQLAGGMPVKQTFNSLFIWQKDKVIRVVFKYAEKLGKKNVDIPRATTINSIIPVIKDYKVYAAIQQKNPYGNFILDDTGRAEDMLNTAAVQRYKLKAMININKWNYRNNPLADTLATTVISVEEAYTLARNINRKAQYENNLPFIFRLPGNDSFFSIKPYRIDVYQPALSISTPAGGKKISKYSLYTTISLMDNSFNDEAGNIPPGSEEEYNLFMHRFISYHTWLDLYDFSLPTGEQAVLQYLQQFPLAVQQFYPARDSAVPCVDIPNDPYRQQQPPGNTGLPVAGAQAFDGCREQFRYCAKCYDARIPLREKIKGHCAINIIPRRNVWPDENWAFLFTAGKQTFFKAELPVEQNDCGSPQLEQLFSPGIGFWMSNISLDNTGRYFIPDKNRSFFLVNNQTINNFFKD